MGVSTQSTWELRFDRPTAMVGYLFLLLIVGVTVGVEGSKIVAEVNEDDVEAYIPDKGETTKCDILMKYTVKDGDDGDKEWSQSRIQKKKSKAYCKHTKVNFKTPVVLEFDVGDNKLMRVELTGKERKKIKEENSLSHLQINQLILMHHQLIHQQKSQKIQMLMMKQMIQLIHQMMILQHLLMIYQQIHQQMIQKIQMLMMKQMLLMMIQQSHLQMIQLMYLLMIQQTLPH